MPYTEDHLIEQPAIALFNQLGWTSADCSDEFAGGIQLGRATSNEVILTSRLLPILTILNPQLPYEALTQAVEELTRDRSVMSTTHANREVYQLLKDGVRVTFQDDEGREWVDTAYLVDWRNPENNDFFLASQFWVTGDLHKRRPDLVGFVNGIPLVLIELKAVHKNLVNAYNHNLSDYKDTIPHLFWYNAIIILSNGHSTAAGSMSARWEHFNEWKKINSEGEEGIVSLETVIRGICQKARLLDFVENFTLFAEKGGGLQKLVAKNHQYLGVNNAFASIQRIKDNQGRLGVFWHTQGSGKSYSMIFFAQKVLRLLPGNWTFVVITDRRDLDDQIYKNFAAVNAVTESEERVRAASGEHLKQLLTEDHRYVFTLIHKFHAEKGETYPVLSERSDIIILTDEAHRTQYDVLALNMRSALPNAAFLAFTGTPLIAGEERTKQVFGNYVSVYNFKQSIEDQSTVPLYYENRIPELQLKDGDFQGEMEELLEQAALDERQEEKLEREFSREYHLITRTDRLEKIAEDVVLHFVGRGFKGKAMFIAIDKATAVRMYDKVQKHWNIQLAALKADFETASEEKRPELAAIAQFMEETDMAVVVSQGQNEIAEMQARGLDIRPHRKRMLEEDLDTRFKDPDDPFRIVFVCAMWMTGFDVPSCSTIYLDKPMRNHTLMQTIARANRVFPDKMNGLIVDYIGVFRSLQKALAIYGVGPEGKPDAGDMPVELKAALVAQLVKTIQEARSFLKELNIDLDYIHEAAEDAFSFRGVAAGQDAVDAVLINDDTKRTFLGLSAAVDRLFKAILPDQAANQYSADRKAIVVIAEEIRSLTPPADITELMEDVEYLLDEYVLPKSQGYVIREPAQGGATLDLSRIDFDALRRQFERSRKRIEAERLRGLLNSKINLMVRLNKTRMEYQKKLEQMIDEYNTGAKNVDAFFAELITLAQRLNEEEQRGITEQLNEEELALFDILTRPEVKLSRKEKEAVKAVARELLDTLKAEYLVLDWRKRQQSRAAVQVQIETILDRLPDAFDKPLYDKKCARVFHHVFDMYYGAGRSIYG